MNVVIANHASKTYTGPWNWDMPNPPPSQYMAEDDAVAMGYSRVAIAPVPASVPKWAFILVLRRMGKEAALKTAIAGYTGPNADRVRAKWEVDPDVERDGQTVDDLGAAMGLMPPQIDQVFRDAEKEANQ